MAEVFEMVFWKKFVNGLSTLWIAFGADTVSRFVNHPKFSDGFLLLKTELSEGFHFGVVRYKHVFEDTFSIDSDEAKLDDLFGLSTGANGLETDPSAEPDKFVIVGSLGFDDLAEAEENVFDTEHLSNNTIFFMNL